MTWIGTVHTDGVFRGWKQLFTYNDFMALTWYKLPLLNGAKAQGEHRNTPAGECSHAKG
ncbi:hypothetical protein KQR57_22370 [Bacillus inaquosorum]|nr:hypothetical protein [Bacillus inaquosorum]